MKPTLNQESPIKEASIGDEEEEVFQDKYFQYESFKSVFPKMSSFTLQEGISLEEAYTQLTAHFNIKDGLKRKKGIMRRGSEAASETFFVKIYKIVIGKKEELNETEAIGLKQEKQILNSLTYIEVPLTSAEISADLSTFCFSLSKIAQKKFDVKNLECIFRNLNSSPLILAKDYLFPTSKALKTGVSLCEYQIHLHLNPLHTVFRQIASILG